MRGEVVLGFRGALDTLKSELPVMPLSRWNESVLRYYFSRAVALAHPGVEQFVECDKIDLVLAGKGLRAFVEFKFYVNPRRFDPYGRPRSGFKGGPSLKNLAEFRSCVDQLAGRTTVPGLSKYVVLVYADGVGGRRAKHRYSSHYDEYAHPTDTGLGLVESAGPIESIEGTVLARLFEITGVPARDDARVL